MCLVVYYSGNVFGLPDFGYLGSKLFQYNEINSNNFTNIFYSLIPSLDLDRLKYNWAIVTWLSESSNYSEVHLWGTCSYAGSMTNSTSSHSKKHSLQWYYYEPAKSRKKVISGVLLLALQRYQLYFSLFHTHRHIC